LAGTSLLRFMSDVPNITLELAGGAGTGKSLAQQLATAVATSPDPRGSARRERLDDRFPATPTD